MMKSVVIVGLLIATSLAQLLLVTPLTDSTVQNGILGITTTANNYATDLYSFYVPPNANGLTVTFSNTNTQCTYLHLFLRTSGLPCNYNQVNGSYLCGNSADPGNGLSSGAHVYNYQPGDSDSLFEFVAGGNVYFGISRYGTYNTYACTYTLVVNASTCANDTVGNTIGTLGVPCANYTAITLPYSANITNTDDEAEYLRVHKFTVAQNTGHVMVVFTVDSTNSYLYGKSYSAPDTSYYNCYQSSYIASNQTGFYQYTMFCYTPRSGDFYVTVRDYYGFSNGTISITALVCGPGMGGFACTYPSTALDFSVNSTASFTGTITQAESDLTYPFVYYYFDMPMNYSGAPIRVNLASTAGSAYLYVRVDGYPEDSSTYGYEDSSEYDSAPASYIIDGREFGRIYFGVECYSATACNYNLGLGVAASITTLTTGMNTPPAMMTTAMSGTPVMMTTGTRPATPTTGLRPVAMTTSPRNVSATSTSTSSQVGTTTGSALAMIPSLFLVALIAMMF